MNELLLNELSIKHNKIRTRILEHNDKVERNYRNDNECFYSCFKFYILKNLRKQGKALFEEISNIIKSEEVDFHTAIKPNPSMNTVSPRNNKNDEFFADIDKMPFDELVKKYVPEPSIAKKVMSKMKRIVKKIMK